MQSAVGLQINTITESNGLSDHTAKDTERKDSFFQFSDSLLLAAFQCATSTVDY